MTSYHHFSKIILTIGIPGSGKSTWVNKYIQQYPFTKVISTDKIREELTGQEQCINPSQNPMIHEEARKRVKAILDDPENYKGGNCGMGPEVIVDATNVEVEEWIRYKKLDPTLFVCKIFDVPPKQALQMQEQRERKVPLHILEMKWKQLQQNKHFIPCFFNMIL